MAKKQNTTNTPIKFRFNKVCDYATWREFKTLATIQGQDTPDYLINVIQSHMGSKVGDVLREHTWVSASTLLERLESDYNISICKQTFYNYRSDGYLDGMFKSVPDTKKRKVVYQLESVAEVCKERQSKRIS